MTALVDALRGISYTGAIVLEVVPTGADATAPDIDDRLPSIIDGYLRESVIALRVHLGQR